MSTKYSGEVYIIDRAKFAVIGKIEFLPHGVSKTDVTPVDVLITKDGKTAFVTLGHAARIAVVDVPTRKTQGYISVGQRSEGLGMSRDGKTLYAVNGFGDDITVVDLKTQKSTVAIPVGRIPRGIVIDD